MEADIKDFDIHSLDYKDRTRCVMTDDMPCEICSAVCQARLDEWKQNKQLKAEYVDENGIAHYMVNSDPNKDEDFTIYRDMWLKLYLHFVSRYNTTHFRLYQYLGELCFVIFKTKLKMRND